jgi:dihydrofolate synthase/folylpolyglutamate synthase
VLDGAHTPAAAAAFAAALRDAFPDRLATAVVGLSADKDAVAVVAALAPAVRGVVATRADSPRAADPAALGEAARGTGLPAIVVPTVSEALARARDVAGPVGLIAVTGSLFVVAEAREALGLAAPDPAWGPSLAEGTGGGMR